MSEPPDNQHWSTRSQFNSVHDRIGRINNKLIPALERSIKALQSPSSGSELAHYLEQVNISTRKISDSWRGISDSLGSGVGSSWYQFPGLQQSIDRVNSIPSDILEHYGVDLPVFPAPITPPMVHMQSDLRSTTTAVGIPGMFIHQPHPQRHSRSPSREAPSYVHERGYRDRSPVDMPRRPYALHQAGFDGRHMGHQGNITVADPAGHGGVPDYIPVGYAGSVPPVYHDGGYGSTQGRSLHARPGTHEASQGANMYTPQYPHNRPQSIDTNLRSEYPGRASVVPYRRPGVATDATMEVPAHLSSRGHLTTYSQDSRPGHHQHAHRARPTKGLPFTNSRPIPASGGVPVRTVYPVQSNMVDTHLPLGRVVTSGLNNWDSSNDAFHVNRSPVRPGRMLDSTSPSPTRHRQGPGGYLSDETPWHERSRGRAASVSVKSGGTPTPHQHQPQSRGGHSRSESPIHQEDSVKPDNSERPWTRDLQGTDASPSGEYISAKSEAGDSVDPGVSPATLDLSNITRASTVPPTSSSAVQQRVHISSAWTRDVSLLVEAGPMAISRQFTDDYVSDVESEMRQGHWNVHPYIICKPYLGGDIMHSTIAGAWEGMLRGGRTVSVGPLQELVDVQSLIANRGVLSEDDRALRPAVASCRNDACMCPTHLFVDAWSPGASDPADCDFIHDYPVETEPIPLYCPTDGPVCRPASFAMSPEETALGCWLHARGYTSMRRVPSDELVDIPPELLNATYRLFELRVFRHEDYDRMYAFHTGQFRLRDYIRGRDALSNPPSAQPLSDGDTEMEDNTYQADSPLHGSHVKNDSPPVDDNQPAAGGARQGSSPEPSIKNDSPPVDDGLLGAGGTMHHNLSLETPVQGGSPAADKSLGRARPMRQCGSPLDEAIDPYVSSQAVPIHPAQHRTPNGTEPQSHDTHLPPQHKRHRSNSSIPDSSYMPSSPPGQFQQREPPHPPGPLSIPRGVLGPPASGPRLGPSTPSPSAMGHDGQVGGATGPAAVFAAPLYNGPQAEGLDTIDNQRHQTPHTTGTTRADIDKMLADAADLILKSTKRRVLSKDQQSQLEVVQTACLRFWLGTDEATRSFQESSSSKYWTSDSPQCILCAGPYHMSIPEEHRIPPVPFSAPNKRTRTHYTVALLQHIKQHRQAETVQAEAYLNMILKINWLRMEIADRNNISMVIGKLKQGWLPELNQN